MGGVSTWRWAEAVVLDADDADRQLLTYRGTVFRPSSGGARKQTLLCPQPGLLLNLVDRFEGMRARFRTDRSTGKTVQAFVQPPRPHFRPVDYGAEPYRLVFELREPDARAGFAGWPLTRTAELVETVRDSAAKHLRDAVPDLDGLVERFLIGRNAVNADKPLRVSILPIPSIGHEHADMGIRRLAIRVPQTCPLSVQDVAWAFSQVTWLGDEGVVEREIQRADMHRMVRRFEQPSRRWLSVTPLALPKAKRRRIDPSRHADHAKSGTERTAEERRAVAALQQSLRHAAVFTPVESVRVQREPFNRRGDRAEAFAPGTRFPKEALWHASITFANAVSGPLVLGDGRYLGLGLMRPAEEPVQGVIAFSIVSGLSDRASPTEVANAGRRAMMARVQARLPRGDKLPTYVSGHGHDGTPASDGIHRHIAVIADLPRRRLLYVAPTHLQRSPVRWQDINLQHTLATEALEGMDVLRAGSAGLLNLVATVVDPDRDVLFAPARIWESVTDYHVTRHRSVHLAENALELDVASELERAGWPSPELITVLNCRGTKGVGLSGKLRLVFRSAQVGPLIIGRTAHKGGGLFASGCR